MFGKVRKIEILKL